MSVGHDCLQISEAKYLCYHNVRYQPHLMPRHQPALDVICYAYELSMKVGSRVKRSSELENDDFVRNNDEYELV